MSYLIASISNEGGAPEQAYRKMQVAAACPERPFAGAFLPVAKPHPPPSAALSALACRDLFASFLAV
jgi:hypothetical protein